MVDALNSQILLPFTRYTRPGSRELILIMRLSYFPYVRARCNTGHAPASHVYVAISGKLLARLNRFGGNGGTRHNFSVGAYVR